MEASLTEALRTSPREIDGSSSIRIYDGIASKSWGNGGITHGGYAVGIVLSAAAHFQSLMSHPDPLHITAHYLQPIQAGACTVTIERVRQGKSQTLLDAELTQDGIPKILTRIVYGVLPDLSMASPSDRLTLVTPNPLARRIPLSHHPVRAKLDKPDSKLLYQNKSEDMYFKEKNIQRPLGRRADNFSEMTRETKVDSLASGTFEWAAWFELKNKDDRIDLTMLPFFADCMRNLPSLLPREHRPGPSWFATVVLTVDFNSKIPSFDSTLPHKSLFAPRTVGIYSTGRFIVEGRHDQYVEIWTSPSEIGCGSENFDDNWREKQICLATSTQMALTIPEERSRRRKENSRL